MPNNISEQAKETGKLLAKIIGRILLLELQHWEYRVHTGHLLCIYRLSGTTSSASHRTNCSDKSGWHWSSCAAVIVSTYSAQVLQQAKVSHCLISQSLFAALLQSGVTLSVARCKNYRWKVAFQHIQWSTLRIHIHSSLGIHITKILWNTDLDIEI